MRKASCVPELCRIEMRVMKNRRLIIIACGTALLLAASPAEVRVKAVERNLAAATALMAGPTSRYDTLISHEAK